MNHKCRCTCKHNLNKRISVIVSNNHRFLILPQFHCRHTCSITMNPKNADGHTSIILIHTYVIDWSNHRFLMLLNTCNTHISIQDKDTKREITLLVELVCLKRCGR